MAKQSFPANPFYTLLVLVGVVFVLTACAYGLMTLKADHAGRGVAAHQPPSGLLAFLDRHGAKLLAGELLVLGITTVAAMALDQARSRRGQK